MYRRLWRWSPRLLLAVVLTMVISAAAAAQQPAPPLVFDGVTVVDVEHGTLLPARRVVILGNRIQAVDSAGAVKIPTGARVIDARDKYLIPGLWDLHAHIGTSASDFFLSLLIANGVTGVRDPGDNLLDSVRRWRRDINAGVLVGPRILAAGALLQGAGGGYPVGSSEGMLEIATADDGRRAVDSLQRAGADMIKAHWNWLPADVFFAILAEGRRRGIPIVGHAMQTTTLLAASDSGYRTIEHISQLVDSSEMIEKGPALFPPWLLGTCAGASASLTRCQAVADRLRHNGTWITPTLAIVYSHTAKLPVRSFLPYDLGPSPADTASGAASFDAFYRPIFTLLQSAGMPLLAGTDGVPGGLAGFLVHEELSMFVREGLTPLGALQTATLNPALYLGTIDSLGTVTAGKVADLVLLDGNPLQDIANTSTIRAVVANGRYFDRAALDQLLAEVKKAVAKGP